MTISRPIVGLLIAAFVMLGSACEETQSDNKSDAGAEKDAGRKKNLLDPVLQKSAAARASVAPPSANEPPPGGVFAAGLGDKAHPPGAPPKLSIISAGSDPKMSLKPLLAIDKRVTIRVKPVKQIGRAKRPAIIYTLAIRTRSGEDGKKKPKKDPKPSATAAATAAPAAGPTVLVAVVKAVDNTDKGNIAQKTDEQISKLVGSRITADLTASGSIMNPRTKVSKKAEGVGHLLESLVESLELLLSPVPSQPVGLGGQWMATDRTKIGGMELIRYRVTRVEKVAGDNFARKGDIRHYGASESAVPAGLDPAAGFIIAKLDSFGHASYTRTAGQLLPSSGQVQLPLVAQLASPKQQAAGGIMQQVLTSEIVAAPSKDKK